MKRRSFLVLAGGALAGASLPGCAAFVATTVTPVDGVIRLTIRNFPQLQQPGGYLKIRPAGSEVPLYVLNQSERGFTVVSSICTHLQCTINVEGSALRCPCHGSEFDREGNVRRGPAARPLDRFPATVTDAGELVIRYGAQA